MFSRFSLLKEVMRPVELSLLAFLNVSLKWPLDGRHSLILRLQLQEVLTVRSRQRLIEVENCIMGQVTHQFSSVSYCSYNLETRVGSFSFYRQLCTKNISSKGKPLITQGHKKMMELKAHIIHNLN